LKSRRCADGPVSSSFENKTELPTLNLLLLAAAPVPL